MNLASWIVLVIIVMLVVVIICGMIKKSGKGMSPTCGCGCAACSKNCAQRQTKGHSS